MSYNNETKYKFKWIKIGILIMITVMVIIIEKGYLTSSCNNKKTRLIFDNVTKQLRFKNSARSIKAFPFLLQSLYTIIIIIIWIYFINSIY